MWPYIFEHAHPAPGEAEALAFEYQRHPEKSAERQAAWDKLNQFYFQAIIRQARFYAKWGNGRATIEVLISYGCEGVKRAAEKYSPKMKATFTTYVFPWIRAFIRRGLQQEAYLISLPTHMQDHLMREGRGGGDTEDLAKRLFAGKRRYALNALHSQEQLSLNEGYGSRPSGGEHSRTLEEFLVCDKSFNDLEAGLRRGSFLAAIGHLPERAQKILIMRFVNDATLDEIGAEFGFSRERARQLVNEALERVRHRAHLLEV